jgi:hypothetical protein
MFIRRATLSAFAEAAARIMLADNGKRYVVKFRETCNARGCWQMTTWPAGWRE